MPSTARADTRAMLNVFVEPFLQVAYARFDVLSLGFADLEEVVFLFQRDANLEQVIECDHATSH